MTTSGSGPTPSARQPQFFVAEGPITRGAAVSERYAFRFTSPVVGPTGAGTFGNDVTCRKWTDTSGSTANTPCLVAPGPEISQPERGWLVNVGDVRLDVPEADLELREFTLRGAQTHGTEDGFAIFLFTGEGKTTGGAPVVGVGRVRETLVPTGAPKPESWRFVFTIGP